MKRAAVLVSALAVVLYTVGISAQAPGLAGKWTMQMDPNAAPAGGGGGGRGGGRGGGPVSGMEVTIAQDATTLTINKVQGQNPVTLKYTLDGKDSKNKVMMGQGGEIEQTSQATVAGGKITITTTMDMGRGPTTTKQVLSLDNDMLKVETTAPGRGGGEPTTTTTTYKKG